MDGCKVEVGAELESEIELSKALQASSQISQVQHPIPANHSASTLSTLMAETTPFPPQAGILHRYVSFPIPPKNTTR